MIQIKDKHPADIAEQLAMLSKKERDISFLMLGDKRVEVFSYFDDQTKEEIIKSLGDRELSEFINNMSQN